MAKSFLNRAHNTFAQKIGARLLTLCLMLLFLSLLTHLSAARQPVSTAAPAAVGQNAIWLAGEGYVEVPYNEALNPSGGSITIEGWVRRRNVTREETLVGNDRNTSYWLGFTDTGHLRFVAHGSVSGVNSEAIIPANRWTHVAVTYDGTTRHYYINGVLDKVSTDHPGALVPSTSDPLGIGFDPNVSFTSNYFDGGIDNVRIWNVVRTGAQIRDSMFQSLGGPQRYRSTLLAEWSFNGDATDSVGGNDGTVHGTFTLFNNEGAIPHDVRIPQVGVAPALDGVCNVSSEYANATQITVQDTVVQLLHTDTDLWVCFDDLGSSASSANVYLDVDYTRLDPAQPEHLLLQVRSDDSKYAYVGASDGGYTATTSVDGQWAGKYFAWSGEFPTYRAEFRINADLLGGWSHVIGLSLSKVVQSGFFGFRYLWPALAVYNQPSTWSSSILGGIGPSRTFSGEVVYQPRDSSASPVGVAGVKVDLIGSDPSGGEALVATVETNLDGSFELTTNDDYANHRLELGAPPKGYLVEKAETSAPGVVVDARTVDYGAAPGGSYVGTVFTLGESLPYVVDTQNSPYFLIVAKQKIIDSGALNEFLTFKARMGFEVEVVSVETIDASFGGDDRLHKIRALEQERLATYGSRFQYVLLIGPKSVIPFAHITPWFNGKDGEGEVDSEACLLAPTNDENRNPNGVKTKLTDWYYADLVSNFDSNGNGCLLDGLRADPDGFASGYTPDVKPSFQATVAVGRIPFAAEPYIRDALRNSVRFEQQSEDFKRRTLHAMSNAFLKGQYWSGSSYQTCNGGGQVNKNCKNYTSDAAFVTVSAKSSFLDAMGYLSTVFYESAKPPGSSTAVSPQPLTAQNVLNALEAQPYGLVSVSGHGGSSGVGRTYWNNANGNSTVESPTEQGVDEIAGGTLINTSGILQLTPDYSRGAIYLVAACSTGNPLSSGGFGASLLNYDQGVAWVGGLTMVGVGQWRQPGDGNVLDVQYYTMERLLKGNLRLGDAVWRTLAQQTVADFSGSTEMATGLYGDPTLSYWGNPGGQSTLAAWPMLRYNSLGQSYTPLTGPEVPKTLWSYNGAAPDTSALPPSPVASNNGEVIVAHGTFVDVLRQGSLYQRLNLDNAAFGAPAIAADGTIYVVDTAYKLYAFPYKEFSFYGTIMHLPERERRWALDLGSAPSTSPVIGAGGFIYIGGPDSVALVRPDGVKVGEAGGSGQPLGALAVDVGRALYFTSSTSRLVKVDFFCPNAPCIYSNYTSPAPSTPPLLAYGFVYVGRVDGEVVKLTTDWVEQATFQADSRITAGPVIGPAGQVLVGTENGTLYSLNKDLGQRWQRSVGSAVESVPAFSIDAVYIVSGDELQAYNPYSGAPLWSRDLYSGASTGSVAVGYGRELYVQADSGKVVAFGEGWGFMPILVTAQAVKVNTRLDGIKVEWLLTASPSATTSDAPPQITAAPQITSTSVLLQRSADGGEWEDVAVLPPGTTAFTDTGVLNNTAYAYRLQVLDSEGNDSDFAVTLADVQSLPALPKAPTLHDVTVEASDELGLEWSSPVGDVVSTYRIERGLSAAGPFTTALQTGGYVTATTDTGLLAGTTYFYRVVAVNVMGESNPSAVLSGTTRLLSLPAPENATAILLTGNRVQISWNPGPEGATTEIEYSAGTLAGYLPLATANATGPHSHYPGEPDTYIYRLKFVLDDAESDYAQTAVVVIPERQYVYLPLVLK